MNGLKYRKRPVIVEARRFNNGVFTKREWLSWCPDARIACAGTSVVETLDSRDFGLFTIPGSFSDVPVSEGDWVVKGADGEFYHYKPGWFAASFEPAYG